MYAACAQSTRTLAYRRSAEHRRSLAAEEGPRRHARLLAQVLLLLLLVVVVAVVVVSLVAAMPSPRRNHSLCVPITGDFSPRLICPPGGDVVQTESDTMAKVWQIAPLPKAQECPPGEYPLAEGEEGRTDACAPCPKGTFKMDNGTNRFAVIYVEILPGWDVRASPSPYGRCAPCDAGMACESRTAEVSCEKDSYTPEATSIRVRAARC